MSELVTIREMVIGQLYAIEKQLAAARAIVERDQQRRLLRARASLLALVVEDAQRITADTGR